MLTNKEKMFLENIAKKLQENIGIIREPNIYNYVNLLELIKEQKFCVVFGSSSNCIVGNSIYLKCEEPNENYTDEEYVNFQKDLLYQIWKIAKKKYSIIMMKYTEVDAGYFFRAMLMPKKSFKEFVYKNTEINGCCNVNEVAREFNVDYVEVIKRGNELGIWNKKV